LGRSPYTKTQQLADSVLEWVLEGCCAVAEQGMELVNPVQPKDDDLRSGTESYFSEYSGFRSIKKVPGL